MPKLRVYTFKAPDSLEDILRQVSFQLGHKTVSSFIRKRIYSHPAVKAKLKNTETNDKVHSPQI